MNKKGNGVTVKPQSGWYLETIAGVVKKRHFTVNGVIESGWYLGNIHRVNWQLPFWNCKFRQLLLKLTKFQLPLKLHNVNQFTPLSNFFLVNMTFCKYPMKFCTYVQNAPRTWKIYIFVLCVMRTIVVLLCLFIWGGGR